MKKVLIGLLVFIILIIVALAAVPIFFKDDIKAAIDDQIEKNVNAAVYYDIDKLSLSLFSHFPSLSVGLEDIGVVGKAPFEKDTLVSMASFELAVDLLSVINGSNIVLNGIYLDQPNIKIKVLADGRANYDISIPTEDEVASESGESDMRIEMDRWEITDGNFIYDDQSLATYVSLSGINHSGSGDFGSNIFEMVSQSSVERIDVNYENISYLSNKQVDADITMAIDLAQSKYTFKENAIKINGLVLGVDGFVLMPDEDIVMDLSFGAKETSFKNILSLVPGMFLEGFEDLKTEGEFSFDGRVKGTYNETSMPAYQVNLAVTEGMFQYPELPTAVKNINIKMLVDNKDGVIENTMIDMSQFHMDMGSNPINASILIRNLVDYDMKADINASLNLDEINKMFPTDGLAMKGRFEVDLKADGVYDSVKNIIPKVSMDMALSDGYVKYDEYPIPMENIHLVAKINNDTRRMNDMLIEVPSFGMLLDGEKLEATLRLEDLSDYKWDAQINGTIDLEKILKIFPQEGITMAGKVFANVSSSGRMSDIESERYERLLTKGNMNISGFRYSAGDLPQGFAINEGVMEFTPQTIKLQKFDAKIGNSDMKVTGSLTNYMAYALQENEVLKGNMTMSSQVLDLNEWMTEDESSTGQADTAALEVIKVPENIDFEFRSSITKLLYDNLVINNMNGLVIVRDGAVSMQNLNFKLLEGDFRLDGAYITKNLDNPLFRFDFKVNKLAVGKTYEAFDMVKALAPIAKNVTGNFSTDFTISGSLAQDMMPIYTSLTGGGLVEVAQAALKDVKILQAASLVSKLDMGAGDGTINLKDILMKTEIKQGRLFLDPFDVTLGGRKMTIAGSNGIDGSLDYVMSTSIPAGSAGTAINSALAQFTGGNAVVGENINLNLKVSGTYDEPKVGIASAKPSGASGAGAGAKAELSNQVEEQKKQAEAEAKAELDKQKAAAEKKAAEEAVKLEDAAKDELNKLIKSDSGAAQPVEDAKDALKGLLKKKKGG